MFCNGVCLGVGSVYYLNASSRGVGYIDIIRSHPATDNDFKEGWLFHQSYPHLAFA